MFGTVGMLRVRPGRLDDLVGVIRELEGRPGVIQMGLVARGDDAQAYAWTIVWESQAAHDTNGERPEFPALYERLLAALDGEPLWHSGPIGYRYG